MAKKIISSKTLGAVSRKPAKAVAGSAISTQISTPVSTPVRNTPIPKVASKKTPEITTDAIARRAYEIHLSGRGGSELDNWFAAERELRSGI